MNRPEKILLVTLAAINFTNILDFMIMMPLGPQLMRLFHITPQQFGALVSSYTISAGVSGLFTAFIIDKFDRKKFLQVLYAGFLIGTLACGLANNYAMLMFARIFTGLFGGVLGAIILSIVGDTIPFERRGQAMGMIMVGFSAASVFGVPFGLFIATKMGWQAPFIFLSVLALPLSYFIWRFVPAVNAHLNNEKQRIGQIVRSLLANTNQRKAITLMMVLMYGHFSIIPFLSPYMVANVGFMESELTYIYLIGGAFNIFTGPIIGKLSDRLGKLKVYTLFVVLCSLPVFAITQMPQVALWIALIATTFFFILSGGRFIPAQAMVSETVQPQMRGSFMSILSSMQQLSAGVAAYVSGLIISRDPVSGHMEHYDIVGYISIAMTLSTIFLIRRIRKANGETF
ncbi:MAG: MFS transporter [Bacteroidota bacterium]|nr:MFS transporter [Sphingobacteriales bacterium]